MATHITTLIENHQDPDHTLQAEHGISFFVRHNTTSLIFDTGQSDRFIRNAATLGVDLSAARHIVLSHSHYDHTDGLPHLMEHRRRSPLTLHLHAAFFGKKYADEDTLRYNGPSWDQTSLQTWTTDRNHPVTLNTVDRTGTAIAPGVHIVTGFDRTHPLEIPNPRFLVHRDDPTGHTTDFETDDFRDEQCLVLETGKGLVVLVGCSHPGIMNMLDTIRSRFAPPIYAVLGGTHLIEAQGPRLKEAIAYLTDGTIGHLGLSHCTGEAAMKALANHTAAPTTTAAVGTAAAATGTEFFPNVSGTTFSVS